MSPQEPQQSSSANVVNKAIKATTFTPSGASARKARITTRQLIIAATGLMTLFVFWFMFSSKSVKIELLPQAESVSIQGGFSFALGDVFLLREGSYTLTAQTAQHEELHTNFMVGSSRNQKFDFAFVPLPGFLDLILNPTDAVISIDARQSQANIGPHELAAGLHEVIVTHPRYQTTTQTINIVGKQTTQTLNISLQPNWADVSVTSSPNGAQIYVDDVLLEIVTPGTVPALAGEREIRVSLHGYKSHRQQIFAQALVPQLLEPIKLIQADAQINVTSNPQGAGITIDGRFQGSTPLQLDLASNRTYKLDLILNGYDTYTRKLNPKQGDQSQLHANLNKQFGEVVFLTEPQGAVLSIDGKKVGLANQTLQLPIRSHEISIALSGHAGYSASIAPKVGLTQEVRVRLLTHAQARLRALTPTISAPNGENLRLFEPFTYTAGASRREPGRRANETLRQIEMSKLFYLSTREVTNAQFRVFASGHDSGKFVEASLDDDDMPVANVSWHDAAAYCNWLSEQANLSTFYEMQFSKVIGTYPKVFDYLLKLSGVGLPGRHQPGRTRQTNCYVLPGATTCRRRIDTAIMQIEQPMHWSVGSFLVTTTIMR